MSSSFSAPAGNDLPPVGGTMGKGGKESPQLSRLADAVGHLASRVQASPDRLTMQMNDSPLGKLRITVTGQGASVQVRIVTEDGASRARLAREGNLLRGMLHARGVKLDGIKIEALKPESGTMPPAVSGAFSSHARPAAAAGTGSSSAPHAGMQAAGGEAGGHHPGTGGRGAGGSSQPQEGSFLNFRAAPAAATFSARGREAPPLPSGGIDLRI